MIFAPVARFVMSFARVRKWSSICSAVSCVYPVKLKNLKANHNDLPVENAADYPVKLKNLKANHNGSQPRLFNLSVVYIRKVKKSESKSQHYNESENLLKAL